MANLREIKDDLYAAISEVGVTVNEYDDGACLADEIFDEVAGLLRRHFGLSLNEADVLLADTKAHAIRTLGEAVNDCVDLRDTINAIAESLSVEEAAT
jgi:hypothetical protein